MKHLSLCILAVLLASFSFAQSYQERAQAYVAKYKDLAIAEQQRTGVPAAIKLGQGILETNAGSSELALNARNHFGIKCKSNWTGETYSYTDDAPDECFRKYTVDLESYRDHSDFLKNNKRYASCFQLNQTDYKSWARELRKCGYATNPRYADQLIKVIEDFNLQDMTYAALNPLNQSNVVLAAASPAPVGDPAPAIVLSTAYPAAKQESPMMARNNDTVKFSPQLPFGRRMTLNGLDGFYARKGELLLESAIKYNVRYARLLEMNDLEDAPLPADMFIYLEKKKSSASKATHVVAAGETMLTVAQAEGIQLKSLRRLNQMEQNEEPAPGAILQLQQASQAKPETAAYVYEAPRAKDVSPVAESNLVAGGKQATSAAAIIPQEDKPAKQSAPIQAPQQEAAPAVARVNIADEKAVDEANIEEAEPEATTEVEMGYGVAPVAPATPAAPAQPGDKIDQLKALMDKAVYTQPAASKTAVASAAPAPQAAPAVDKTTSYHTVTTGETAFSIAKKYGITMKQLIDWNSLDFGKIKVGQKLRVK